jgi:hypothetical protein
MTRLKLQTKYLDRFICALPAHDIRFPRVIRNYRSRENPWGDDIPVWKAAQLTTAMLGLTDNVSVGHSLLPEPMTSGELRWSNPAPVLTIEASSVFPNGKVSCIISIGSGELKVLSTHEDSETLFSRLAADCHVEAEEMSRRFQNVSDFYWRLNVDQGFQNLDEVDLEKLPKIVSSTAVYLSSHSTRQTFEHLTSILRTRQHRVPIYRISGQVPESVPFPTGVAATTCPLPTLYFTGRESTLREIRQCFEVDSGRCNIVVLSGIGGGGKTELGLEVVRQNRQMWVHLDLCCESYPDRTQVHGCIFH